MGEESHDMDAANYVEAIRLALERWPDATHVMQLRICVQCGHSECPHCDGFCDDLECEPCSHFDRCEYAEPSKFPELELEQLRQALGGAAELEQQRALSLERLERITELATANYRVLEHARKAAGPCPRKCGRARGVLVQMNGSGDLAEAVPLETCGESQCKSPPP